MKHINIQAHFICDAVNDHLIDVHHIPGAENPADLLTKPLHWIIHHIWLTQLSMDTDLPTKEGHRSWEGVMTY
jgi:hypothetical protein